MFVEVLPRWRALEPGVGVSAVMFQSQGGSKARWVGLVIWKRARSGDFARGRELFDDPAYGYQAILTNKIDARSCGPTWKFRLIRERQFSRSDAWAR